MELEEGGRWRCGGRVEGRGKVEGGGGVGGGFAAVVKNRTAAPHNTEANRGKPVPDRTEPQHP